MYLCVLVCTFYLCVLVSCAVCILVCTCSVLVSCVYLCRHAHLDTPIPSLSLSWYVRTCTARHLRCEKRRERHLLNPIPLKSKERRKTEPCARGAIGPNLVVLVPELIHLVPHDFASLFCGIVLLYFCCMNFNQVYKPFLANIGFAILYGIGVGLQG